MFDSLFPKEWTTLQRLMWLKTNALARAVYETISGNPVSFTAKAATLRQLKVAFSPKQDLHGYDAPWPAGGGANKADQDTLTHTGVIQDTGEVQTDSKRLFTTHIPVVPSADYYLKIVGKASSGEILRFNRVIVFDSNGDFISRVNGWKTGGTLANTTEGVVTIPANAYFIQIDIRTYSLNIGLDKTDVEQLMMAQSSVSVPYAPYSNICPISGWDSLNVYHSGADTSNPQTISITIGSTVYSGTVDVVTGVGKVTMASVDLGTLNWAVISQAGEGVFSSTSLNGIIKPSIWSTEMFHGISTIYAPAIGADVYKRVKDNTIGADGNGRLYTFDPAKSGLDKNEYKTAMNGVQLVYELATPIPIQLTPQEVESLAGDNTMFTPCDSLTVEYRSN